MHAAIVDDHIAIRNGYKSILETLPYFKQITLFESGNELLNLMKKEAVDFVMLDISLKDEDGLDVCLRIKKQCKLTKVIMISTYHSEPFIIQSEKNNADGYLFKDAGIEEVEKAIMCVVVHGKKYYSTEAKLTLFDHAQLERDRHENPKLELTERELEIIRYVCKGHSNKMIGEILGREETTIAKHKQNIMQKLGLHSTVEIMSYAVEKGLYLPEKNSTPNKRKG